MQWESMGQKQSRKHETTKLNAKPEKTAKFTAGNRLSLTKVKLVNHCRELASLCKT